MQYSLDFFRTTMKNKHTPPKKTQFPAKNNKQKTHSPKYNTNDF